MPIYTFQDETTGRKYRVEGSRPPSPEEMAQIAASASAPLLSNAPPAQAQAPLPLNVNTQLPAGLGEPRMAPASSRLGLAFTKGLMVNPGEGANKVLEYLARFTEQGSLFPGVNRMFAEQFQGAADVSRQMRDEFAQEQSRQRAGAAPTLAEKGIETASQTLSSAGPGFALGAPATIAIQSALSGGQFAADAEKEYLEQGLTPEKARMRAAAVGSLAGATEGAITKYLPVAIRKIPGIGKVLGGEGVEAAAVAKTLGERLSKATLGGRAATVVKEGLSEIPEENLQELAESLNRHYTVKPNPNGLQGVVSDWLQSVPETSLLAFISSGAINTVNQFGGGNVVDSQFAKQVRDAEQASGRDAADILADQQADAELERSEAQRQVPPQQQQATDEPTDPGQPGETPAPENAIPTIEAFTTDQNPDAEQKKRRFRIQMEQVERPDVLNRMNSGVYPVQSNESSKLQSERIVGTLLSGKYKGDLLSLADDLMLPPGRRPIKIEGQGAGAVESGVLLQVQKLLGVAAGQAQQEGDIKGYEDVSNAQATFNEFVEQAYTSAGQFTQMAATFQGLTPMAVEKIIRRKLKGSKGSKLDPQVTALVNQINQQGGEAAQQLTEKLGPEFQKAAQESQEREAATGEAVEGVIDEATGKSDTGKKSQTRKRVQTTVDKAFGQKPDNIEQSVWDQYRQAAVDELVRSFAPARGGKAPPPLDDFTRSIVKNLKQAVESKAKAKKPDGRSAIQQLADIANEPGRFQEVLDQAIAKLKEEYAGDDAALQRIAQLDEQGVTASDQLVNAAIRDQMQRLGLSLRNLINKGFALRRGDGVAKIIEDALEQAGLDLNQAKQLAQLMEVSLNREIGRIRRSQAEAQARKKADTRTQTEKLGATLQVADETSTPDAEIEKVLSEQMKQAHIKLADVVKRHFTEADATGAGLAMKIAAEMGISKPRARLLSRKIEDVWRNLTAEKRKQIIEQAQKRASGKLTTKKGKETMERLVEAANIGFLSEERAWNVVAESLGLPEFSPALRDEIHEIADRYQRLPDGSIQKQEVGIEFYNAIDRAVRKNNVPIAAIWYLNMLSGVTTQAINLLGNSMQLGTHMMLNASRRPGDVPQTMRDFLEGTARGFREALLILNTGKVTGSRLTRFASLNPIETWRPKNYKFKPLRALEMVRLLRFVARGMQAVDAFFFKTAERMRQGQQVRADLREMISDPELRAEIEAKYGDLFRAMNVTPDDIRRKRDIMMGRTDRQMSEARSRQATEGAKPERKSLAVLESALGPAFDRMAAQRRIDQILDEGLREDIREDAKTYAQRVTFNNPPYGVMGGFAKMLDAGAQNENILFRAGVRFFIPFWNIVSNVVQEQLAWVPMSIPFAQSAKRRGKFMGQDITELQKRAGDDTELVAKGWIGLVLMVLLARMSDREDEEREFTIHGNGPLDPKQRAQWLAAGNRPNSVQIGDTYIPLLAESPIGMILTLVGNAQDYQQYGAPDNYSKGQLAVAATFMLPTAVLDRSFLRGASDMFNALGDKNPENKLRAFNRIFARGTVNLAVPNLVRQADRFFDPTYYEGDGNLDEWILQVPVARRRGQPKLNGLGDEIEVEFYSRFAENRERDLLWDFILEKQAWISIPSRHDQMTQAEYANLIKLRGRMLRQYLEPRLPALRRRDTVEVRQYMRSVSAAATEAAKERLRLTSKEMRARERQASRTK